MIALPPQFSRATCLTIATVIFALRIAVGPNRRDSRLRVGQRAWLLLVVVKTANPHAPRRHYGALGSASASRASVGVAGISFFSSTSRRCQRVAAGSLRSCGAVCLRAAMTADVGRNRRWGAFAWPLRRDHESDRAAPRLPPNVRGGGSTHHDIPLWHSVVQMTKIIVRFVGGRGREPVVVLAVAEERRADRASGVDGGTAHVHAAQSVPAITSAPSRLRSSSTPHTSAPLCHMAAAGRAARASSTSSSSGSPFHPPSSLAPRTREYERREVCCGPESVVRVAATGARGTCARAAR